MNKVVTVATFTTYTFLAAISAATIVLAFARMESDPAKSWLVVGASICTMTMAAIFARWLCCVSREAKAAVAVEAEKVTADEAQ